MTFAPLIRTVRSGVVHIEFRRQGQRIASGSGFLSKGLLITNNHLFRGPPDCTVALGIQPTQDPRSREEVIIPYQTFARALVSGSDERNFDFAILRLPELQAEARHNFELRAPTDVSIGDPVLVLGFPLEHRNLVCHAGAISSLYSSGPTNVIQLDASVNQSNSGGPLVDPSNGNVLGIVTRKATGLSGLFDQILAAFDQNISALNGVKGHMNISGFDPAMPMIHAQHQMKALSQEIQRSANVGIGYAFSSEHVLSNAGYSALAE